MRIIAIMNNLKKLIKENGFNIEGFAKVALNMPYRTFKYRLDNFAFNYEEIKKIMVILNCKFEDLEGYEPGNKPIKEVFPDNIKPERLPEAGGTNQEPKKDTKFKPI